MNLNSEFCFTLFEVSLTIMYLHQKM